MSMAIEQLSFEVAHFFGPQNVRWPKKWSTSEIKHVVEILSRFKTRYICRHVWTTSFNDFLSHLTIPPVIDQKCILPFLAFFHSI